MTLHTRIRTRWLSIPALRRDQWRRAWRRRLTITPLEVALLLVLGGILWQVVTLTPALRMMGAQIGGR